MSFNIKVRYFAQLKELAEKNEETLEVSKRDSAKSVYYSLSEKYKFPLKFDQIRVAINDEFVDENSPLSEGDSVVFIPPVAGG